MKIKKLNLTEINKAYVVVEPLIKDGVDISTVVDLAINAGKAEKLFRIFFNKKEEFPKDVLIQSLLLETACRNNGFLTYLHFISEI